MADPSLYPVFMFSSGTGGGVGGTTIVRNAELIHMERTNTVNLVSRTKVTQLSDRSVSLTMPEDSILTPSDDASVVISTSEESSVIQKPNRKIIT